MPRSLAAPPDVGQEEGAGSVRALGHARDGASFSEQRSLLVHDQPGQSSLGAEGPSAANDLVTGDESRQPFVRQAEHLEQTPVPLAVVKIQDKGPTGSGDITGNLAGEGVDEPGIRCRDDAVGRQMPADPRHLGRREVGIQDQSGASGQPLAVLADLVADLLSSSVLPHDCRGEGCTRRRIPGQHGLALVRQGNGIDATTSGLDRAGTRLEDGFPKRDRLLFNQATRTIDGTDGNLRQRQDGSVLVHHRCLGSGGPLVDRQNPHPPGPIAKMART
jgi:hypothetical protein